MDKLMEFGVFISIKKIKTTTSKSNASFNKKDE